MSAGLESYKVKSPGTSYWVFRDVIYSTVESLSGREVKALLLEGENRRKSRVAQAVLLMEMSSEPAHAIRAPIPDDVKMFVWQRDGGKCVRCGSNLSLEFDHIIPVSMGGANSARNLQLLCETCNRSKGGSLIRRRTLAHSRPVLDEIGGCARTTEMCWAQRKRPRALSEAGPALPGHPGQFGPCRLPAGGLVGARLRALTKRGPADTIPPDP